MADATVIDSLRLRAVLLAERPDGRGVRGVVLVRRPDPRKPVTVPGRIVKLSSSTAISPRASWSAPRASIMVNATSSPGVNQAKEISGPRIGQKQ
jgi:hypothetical protein